MSVSGGDASRDRCPVHSSSSQPPVLDDAAKRVVLKCPVMRGLAVRMHNPTNPADTSSRVVGSEEEGFVGRVNRGDAKGTSPFVSERFFVSEDQEKEGDRILFVDALSDTDIDALAHHCPYAKYLVTRKQPEREGENSGL